MQDDAVYKLTLGQRALIVLTIVLSTTIYAGSVLISSALLPQLQGALSATQDEVSWVMTFNIVGTAVATPMTGWLADRLGIEKLHQQPFTRQIDRPLTTARSEEEEGSPASHCQQGSPLRA